MGELRSVFIFFILLICSSSSSNSNGNHNNSNTSNSFSDESKVNIIEKYIESNYDEYYYYYTENLLGIDSSVDVDKNGSTTGYYYETGKDHRLNITDDITTLPLSEDLHNYRNRYPGTSRD